MSQRFWIVKGVSFWLQKQWIFIVENLASIEDSRKVNSHPYTHLVTASQARICPSRKCSLQPGLSLCGLWTSRIGSLLEVQNLSSTSDIVNHNPHSYNPHFIYTFHIIHIHAWEVLVYKAMTLPITGCLALISSDLCMFVFFLFVQYWNNSVCSTASHPPVPYHQGCLITTARSRQ